MGRDKSSKGSKGSGDKGKKSDGSGEISLKKAQEIAADMLKEDHSALERNSPSPRPRPSS